MEVKSNLSAQWEQVVAKRKAIGQLTVLERKYSREEKVAVLREMYPGQNVTPVDSPADPVKEKKGGLPFICVGFEGWSDIATVRSRAAEVGSLFVLRHCVYAGVGGSAKGPVAILMFLEYLSSLIQRAAVTIYPTWHYGAMSQLHAERPDLLIEGK
jgi:hypothetical protein